MTNTSSPLLSPSPTLQVALVQYDIVWENPAANFTALSTLLDDLRPDTDLVVLPETFATGFSNQMPQVAEAEEGPSLQFLRAEAQKHHAVMTGTTLVRDAEGRIRNRLYYVYPDGTYGFYDKAHAFVLSDESTQITCGTTRTTFEVKGWRIRTAICYDLRFPTWLRNAHRAGETPPRFDYEVLLLAANWPAKRAYAWNTLLPARAIENLAYVAAVNRVGTDGLDLHYSGHSAAYDFEGRAIASTPVEQTAVAYATFHYDALADYRTRCPFYGDFD